MIIHKGPFVGVLSFEWYMITEYPQTWPMFQKKLKHTDPGIHRLQNFTFSLDWEKYIVSCKQRKAL